MGFGPNCFTCIAHLYLYYTLLVLHFTCTAHLCLLYKALMYIFSWRNIIYTNLPVFLTWYQSHSSDLFLAVLSLLVLFHFQHHFRHHNSHCSLSPLNLQRLPSLSLGSKPAVAIVEESNTAQITAHVILPWLLLRSNFWWYHWDRLETIYPSVKATQSSKPTRALTRRLKFLLQRLTHSMRHTHLPSSSWRHPWRHLCHVNPSCVSIQSSADVSATSSWWRHMLTVDFDRPLTVDFNRLLTFLQGWLL